MSIKEIFGALKWAAFNISLISGSAILKSSSDDDSAWGLLQICNFLPGLLGLEFEAELTPLDLINI
jgi:hypothetical protein